MIFLHLIIGIIFGKITNNYLPWIIGSIIPDIDHIYIAIKNNLLNKKLLDTIKNEEEYKIKYKTPLIHSILGLIIFSIIFYLLIPNYQSTLFFSLAYFIHLIMDWPDKDIKYYLYPLKIKFQGFLPVWSKLEKIITIISILVLIYFYN